MAQTNSHDYRHRAEYRLLLAEGSDTRGPGAAVTVALCGHWEHEGDCQWPHLSAMEAVGDRTYRLIVQFDAPDDELDFRTFAQTLGRHGYDKYISVETFSSMPLEKVEIAYDMMSTTLRDLGLRQ